MTSAVQHIAFRCRDRVAQEQFYSRHFGFSRVRTFNKGAPGEFVMLRLGSTCLELFQASADAEPARQGDEFVGFTHLAFEVTDIEEAAASLQADGITTGEIADCSVHLEGMRVCFFNDPEGNRIELMQGYQDEAQA